MKRIFITFFAILCVAAASFSQSGAPKYVFYFIGDGMGMGHVMTAECYNRTVRGDSSHITMVNFPVASVATTYSYSSPVTDSAAAGTALASGVKTVNGMLGMTPDSAAVRSIAADLHDMNWGVGIVTSVAIDDATPGAFYASQPTRHNYYEIGCQAALSGYEFLAGAGLRGTKTKTGESSGLYELLEANNVAVIRGIHGIDTVNSRRIMLLSTDTLRTNNIGYTIDSVKGALTLPLMTQACLRHLEKQSPDHFFMMVEGGNIDHAGHGNDAATVVKEILNFQEAIDIAVAFYNSHPDETLIVVTADHDTGGLALGNTAVGYDAHLQHFDSQKISKSAFADFCKGLLKSRRIVEWDDMKEYLTRNFGLYTSVNVSPAQDEELKTAFDTTFKARNSADKKTLYDSFNEFEQTVFDILNSATGIGWTSTAHTGGFVPVYALGVGAEKFASVNDNTQISRKILSIINR